MAFISPSFMHMPCRARLILRTGHRGSYFDRFWAADQTEVEAVEAETEPAGAGAPPPPLPPLGQSFSRLSARLGRRLLHGVHGLLHPPPPPECFEWTAGGTEKADAEICVAAMMAGKLLEAGKGRHNRPLSAGHTDGLRKV